jgi:hypothetical protein
MESNGELGTMMNNHPIRCQSDFPSKHDKPEDYKEEK